MPVLYSDFPAPIGQPGTEVGEIAESSHYSDEFLAFLPERSRRRKGHPEESA